MSHHASSVVASDSHVSYGQQTVPHERESAPVETCFGLIQEQHCDVLWIEERIRSFVATELKPIRDSIWADPDGGKRQGSQNSDEMQQLLSFMEELTHRHQSVADTSDVRFSEIAQRITSIELSLTRGGLGCESGASEGRGNITESKEPGLPGTENQRKSLKSELLQHVQQLESDAPLVCTAELREMVARGDGMLKAMEDRLRRDVLAQHTELIIVLDSELKASELRLRQAVNDTCVTGCKCVNDQGCSAALDAVVDHGMTPEISVAMSGVLSVDCAQQEGHDVWNQVVAGSSCEGDGRLDTTHVEFFGMLRKSHETLRADIDERCVQLATSCAASIEVLDAKIHECLGPAKERHAKYGSTFKLPKDHSDADQAVSFDVRAEALIHFASCVSEARMPHVPSESAAHGFEPIPTQQCVAPDLMAEQLDRSWKDEIDGLPDRRTDVLQDLFSQQALEMRREHAKQHAEHEHSILLLHARIDEEINRRCIQLVTRSAIEDLDIKLTAQTNNVSQATVLLAKECETLGADVRAVSQAVKELRALVTTERVVAGWSPEQQIEPAIERYSFASHGRVGICTRDTVLPGAHAVSSTPVSRSVSGVLLSSGTPRTPCRVVVAGHAVLGVAQPDTLAVSDVPTPASPVRRYVPSSAPWAHLMRHRGSRSSPQLHSQAVS